MWTGLFVRVYRSVYPRGRMISRSRHGHTSSPVGHAADPSSALINSAFLEDNYNSIDRLKQIEMRQSYLKCIFLFNVHSRDLSNHIIPSPVLSARRQSSHSSHFQIKSPLHLPKGARSPFRLLPLLRSPPSSHNLNLRLHLFGADTSSASVRSDSVNIIILRTFESAALRPDILH